ncbi:MAG: hypothetical protein ACE5F7_10345 [Nitrospiria bacterium]
MKKVSRHIVFIAIIFFLITSTFLDKNAEAAQEKDASRPWWGEVESGLIYDNNILQVNSNKESDVIWESSLLLSYQPKEIEWYALAVFDRYLDNSELNYAYYEIGGERVLAQDLYGGFSLNVSPTSQLDKQDPVRDPFPISLGSYGTSFFIERDTARYGAFGLNIAYTRLDYNTPFNAKDSNLFDLGPTWFYRFNTAWSFYGQYTHTLAKARRGLIPVGASQFFDDISYRANALSLLVTHMMSKKTRLRFRYKIRTMRFEPDARDTFHLGRKDKTHALYAEVKQSLLKNVLLRGRLERFMRRSNQSFVEFSENRLMLSATYQF